MSDLNPSVGDGQDQEGLSHDDLEGSVGLIMSLCALDQVGRLYDLNNKLVRKVLEDLLVHLQVLAKGREEVSLTCSGYSFFLNHQLIRMDFSRYQKAQQLKQVWDRLGLDEVVFPTDVNEEGLNEFAGKIMKCVTGAEGKDTLFGKAHGGVMVRRVTGVDEGGADAIPVHEAAARIYCVLVALAEKLSHRVRLGEEAPLLQLKQALQAAVDHMVANDGVLLSICRLSPMGPGLPTHLVNTSLLTLRMGMHLGLKRGELMPLATACLFHDLPKAGLQPPTLNSLERPERAQGKDRNRISLHWLASLRRLVLASGISEEALGRLLVLYESQLEFSRTDLYPAKDGEAPPLSLLSQVISVCDAFETLTWPRPEKKSLSPHRAVMALLERGGSPDQLALLRAFMDVVGLYPPGSGVFLESGEVAMVLRATPGAPHKPVVRIVLDASNTPCAGPVVDLHVSPEKSILHEADLAAMGLNLPGCINDSQRAPTASM